MDYYYSIFSINFFLDIYCSRALNYAVKAPYTFSEQNEKWTKNSLNNN